MQLLFDTVESNDSLEWDDEEYGKVEIFVKGMSRRWYKIKAVQIRPLNLNQPVIDPKHWTSSWAIIVKGAAWRSDFNNNSMVVDLCIHTRRSGGRFPIGDSLVSLCLSLANDKITAMDIPLLAQFIICPRKRLSTIEIFQEEGIVTSDMLNQGEDPFGEWEDDWEIEQEDMRQNELAFVNSTFDVLANLLIHTEASTERESIDLEHQLEQQEMRENHIEKMIYDWDREADKVRGLR
jgi:hypothetical protein